MPLQEQSDVRVTRGDESRSLIEFSEPCGGGFRGFVSVEVHISYVHIVSGDESVTVDDVPHFSCRERKENASLVMVMVP